MNCPNCQTPAGAPDWKAHETYLWANQYGYSKRLFCSVCGQWTDFRDRHDSDSRPVIVRVAKQPESLREK